MSGAAVLPRLLEDGALPFATDEGRQHADDLNAFSRGALARDEPKPHPLRDAFEPPLTKALAREVALNDLPGHVADDERAGLRFGLDTSRDVRCVAQREPVLPVTRAHQAYQDAPCMCTETDMQDSPEGQLLAVAQRLDPREDVEPTAYGSLRFVLVRPWVAEVGHHAVAEVLGDVALVGSHRVPTNPLVGRD